MVKINYKKELFKGKIGLTESLFCAPFEDPELFKEEKFENNRFEKLIEDGQKHLEYTNIEDCDYVIIPYKWDGRTQQNLSIINEANKYGKKVISLHNDDFPPKDRIYENEGYLFTTTLDKFSKQKNEFCFPSMTGDFFKDYGSKYVINKSMGFCGAITHPIRNYTISIINQQLKSLTTNFIVRNSFWATNEMSKDEARIGYFQNMVQNTFTLCMRGAGNFSYRLYETMMMGRIPVIIDTNQIFPFESTLDYNEFSIKIDYTQINNIESIISNWLSTRSQYELIEIQKKNRKIWLEYMSPLGWIKNFTKEFGI